MERATFSLADAVEDLWEKVADDYEELAFLDRRASQVIGDFLERIKGISRKGRRGSDLLIKQVTPKKNVRVSCKRTTLAGRAKTHMGGTTRQGATAAKTPRSAKSSAPAEYKQNNEKNTPPTTRSRAKRRGHALIVQPATTAENVPARSTRQRQVGAINRGKHDGSCTLAKPCLAAIKTKAFQVASTPCTPPPNTATIDPRLLTSPVTQKTPPSRAKQLFSPYANCKVEKKAKAFESKKATKIKIPAEATKCTTVAAGAKYQVLPQALEPVMSESPPPTPRPEVSTSAAAAVVEVVSPPTPTDKATRSVKRRTASELRRTVSTSVVVSEGAGKDIAAATQEEENGAPCTPVLAPSPERKRVPRLSVLAQMASGSAGRGPESGRQEKGKLHGLSSSPPSAVGPSPIDDEECRSPATSAETAKIAPSQKARAAWGATGRKGGRHSARHVKTPAAKGRPALTVARKLSTHYCFSPKPRTPTPAATVSRLGRRGGESDKRPGFSVKRLSLGESERHEGVYKEVHQHRKENILCEKADSIKKEREKRLARAQAERQRREALRREDLQERQQEEALKDRERLRKRTAFQKSKQSQRTIHVDLSGDATKRTPKSALPATSKKAGVSLDEEAGVVRSRQGRRVRGRQLVNPGGQLVLPLIAIQADVGCDPLQAQPRAPVRQLRRLLPDAPHQQGGRVSVLDPHQGQPGVAQQDAALGRGLHLQEQQSTPVKPPAPREPRDECREAEPARLILGQPKKFVSQKATLNHSLQQQASPNRIRLPDEKKKAQIEAGRITDEGEKPRNQVPPRANVSSLSQEAFHGFEVFGNPPPVKLAEMFDVEKECFFRRTSSALWDSPVQASEDPEPSDKETPREDPE